MRSGDTVHADVVKLIDSGAIRVICGASGGGGTFVEPHQSKDGAKANERSSASSWHN
jgi:hypothetical protein